MLSNGLMGATLVVLAEIPLSAQAPDGRGARLTPPRQVVPRVAQTSTHDGVGRCRPGPVENYLAPESQQCWFDAPNGRWRILRHELHYDSLVVEVEAASHADADEIAERFVLVHGERFPDEITLYVQAGAPGIDSLIRRVQWTRAGGFKVLEFVGSLRR
jgi:hypothetical protein